MTGQETPTPEEAELLAFQAEAQIKQIELQISLYHFENNLIFVPLRASIIRPAPYELPQDRKVARVLGCSGPMYVACPFFSS